MGAETENEMGAGSELDVDAFHELFPWPEDLEGFGEPSVWLWPMELDASAEKLWPLICDTSRINRELGLARMEVREVDGLRHGVATHGGRRHEWVERPWDWVAGRSLSVVRRYQRGWFRAVRSVYLLEEHERGTRVYVYFGWQPRGALGALMLKLGMAALESKYRAVMDKLAEAARAPSPQKFTVAPPPLSEAARARLESGAARMREDGVTDEVVDQLVEFVRGGDDFDLDSIQPRRLARQWDLDERAVLSGFLYATRHGLLQLSWDVVCPMCRGTREQSDALSEIPTEGACEACNVEFSTSDEHTVEIAFRVQSSVREVPKLYYCTAEPSTKLHIRLQHYVGPGAERVVRLGLSPGHYRIRFLENGQNRRDLVVSEQGATELLVTGQGDAPLSCGVEPLLTLRNESSEGRTFVLEKMTWRDDLLLPEHLLAFQDFRDLFSSDYIASDVRLAVGRQTVLFTDIVGSTRFYAEKGDPGAFIQVRDHFREVYAIVRERHGAVVKTIGDAVMAVFPASADAVLACRDIHQVFDGSSGPIRLRISLHAGPCIAVNWNSTMDFFGGTVNLAAKLQACVEASEVAMSEVVYQAPHVAQAIEAAGGTIDRLDFDIKAIGETIAVVRWSLA